MGEDFRVSLQQEAHDFQFCERCGMKTWRGDLEDDVCDVCWSEEAEDQREQFSPSR